MFGNQPLKIKDSKWSRHKIQTLRGARDFFGPLNGTSDSEGYFGANKVKSEEIVKSTLFSKVRYDLRNGINT